MSEHTTQTEPTADLLAVAEWVKAEPDEVIESRVGDVYRRGRWLATICDEMILAVSAYMVEDEARRQFSLIGMRS